MFFRNFYLIYLLFLIPGVFSAGFHTAEEIYEGVFYGNFSFNGSLDVLGDNLSSNKICLNGVCRTSWPIGTISSVLAGDGLFGGGSSGSVILNVGAGDGIIVNVDNISAVLGSSIQETEIDQNTLDDSEIQDDSLTASSLAPGSVGTSEIQNNGIYEVDLRSTNSPVNNYILSYDSGTGGFTWVPDQVGTGDISAVLAGSGLTGGGYSGSVTLNVGAGTGIIVNSNSVSVDTNYFQRRVTGSCSTGSAIRVISSTGTVTCQSFITGVNAGSNIVVSGTSSKTVSLSSSISVNSVTSGQFIYSSDKNLKKNIVRINGRDALDRLNQINGVYFNWRSNNLKDVGVIAQDVERVFPELVSVDENGYKAVKYGNLIGPLIEAVKYQQEEIEKLKKEIEELKNEK